MNTSPPNPRIRALVVDDEPRSRASLRLQLAHHFPEVEVVGEAETVQQAIELARAHQPDLMFLDIQLPDGSAFDVMDVLQMPQLQYVIVSAHPEHSLRAFQYAAVHYLLKPIDLRDLRTAIARVTGSAQAPVQGLDRQMASQAVVAEGIGNSLALHSLEGFRLITLPEILFCESDANYTIFHFAAGGTFTVTHSLGYYESLLQDKAFFRIHHRFLVNLQHIKAYHRGRGGWVEMANGKQIEVSTRKRDGFLERLGAYARGV